MPGIVLKVETVQDLFVYELGGHEYHVMVSPTFLTKFPHLKQLKSWYFDIKN